MITESKTALFAILCESILTESTIINLLGSSPKTVALARELHKDGVILHSSPFVKVHSIVTNLASHRARLVYHYIFKGEKGDFLYLKTKGERGGNLEFKYVNPDFTVETTVFDNLAPAKKFIKDKIGKIKEIYNYNTNLDTEQAKTHRQEIQKRKEAMKIAQRSTQFTVHQIAKKFKPLFMKSLRNAENEIKGMLITMVRNGHYEEAYRKADKLKSMGSLIDSLELGYDNLDHRQKEWFTGRVTTALQLTAQYLYPDLTGGFIYDGVRNAAGVQEVLNTLNKGNTNTLAIILRFFKNCVVRGI